MRLMECTLECIDNALGFVAFVMHCTFSNFHVYEYFEQVERRIIAKIQRTP